MEQDRAVVKEHALRSQSGRVRIAALLLADSVRVPSSLTLGLFIGRTEASFGGGPVVSVVCMQAAVAPLPLSLCCND